ncbi:fumarylacetoacetate hydrolase family protein [Ponticoccus sp. SC2-23]|uniref:fumarylacetoacetate hydrolase family protein n=1 Tax=Alexandriicola marinus TaxID=2081710 RepID=UPI000FDA6669|nr:fumarylacetoacetate hydrolase family protein [Alexandriicola marinus]MBM1218701.1 fumarylacetoacetate hydrolase family protein [Ponticoccus sp. SC6-9]MBM1224227.1 fumarylacetoacetate hydrolase family protein [Ponticoccus sp. SC6-15]MBM1229994.1 fumarylacetoacetate hydrolase family protein [Ponticoccus sp. SC6-38]MBM1233193.1 fumarylacetoacetate hydrolase family protein [Ponticoccus sp. SC6-45]MBM1236857.1 fumarylacetoacetate hydrolase family protein [Ponticoccus sp. SC6-49]MBM1242204.1 fum
MVAYAVTPPSPAYLDIVGSDEKFPVRRIYCIGKNYLAHVREMEQDERDPPVIFMKPADALVRNGGEIPYPVFTNNFHYECELVVAMKSGGYNISEADASSHIFGYAVGLDMTRRDHQAEALKKGLPWEVTKAFDHSAPVGPITPVETTGIMTSGHVKLKVNGETKQDADISLLIWKIDEIIAKLSEQHALMPGDIIMTGTPAGVGAVVSGDVLDCSVDGLWPMQVRIGEPAA